MSGIAIGIDTGGTYTDAVVLDAATRGVLAKAKALTTRGDLAIGVAEALGAVLAATGRPAEIAAAATMVGLSTTLATNAIVEGHGSAIGVILAGFDARMEARTGIAQAIPGVRLLRCGGGHDHAGDAAAPLDEDAVAAFLHETGGAVAAYAVAAQYSVRNPAHEHRIRQLAGDLTGLPVTLSSDLAHALDAPRRALTAALNARIVARIVALIDAVRRSLAAHGIAAPLMVVKGDGTLATAEAIAERPIETILSGPAASVIGAKFLSGLSDLVVSDIGGTTTDIAVLEDGWPRLDRAGALVGGHRTMVQAIDMRTFGLGGDSEVGFDAQGRLELRPGRIMPLALLGARFPEVIGQMQGALRDPEGQPYAGRYALRPLGHSGAGASGLPARDAELLARIGVRPTPLGEILRGPLARRALDRLVGQGLVALGGFTPSDAAHVLGLQAQWSREASVLGALLAVRSSRMLADSASEAAAHGFARDVCALMAERSARALIAALAGAPVEGAEPFVAAAVGGAGRLGALSVAIRPAAPVVAVGGPAPVFYPDVARRLGCGVLLPEHGDVANAIGAAVAMARARAIVEITSGGADGFRVHAGGAPLPVPDPTRALALAHELARDQALARARAFGVAETDVVFQVERVDLPNVPGDAALVAAMVVAECVGGVV